MPLFNSLSNTVFVASTGIGLVFPPALGGQFLALLMRGQFGVSSWRLHHAFLAMAITWALVVHVQRVQAGTAWPLTPYLAYVWSLPFLVAVFKPDMRTVKVFSQLLITVFLFDFSFNIYSFAVGQDLFGRLLDARPGLLGGTRNGGMFAHSFYSGAISISALITLLDKGRFRWSMRSLALINLALAGSGRLALAVVLVVLLAWGWQRRTRVRELFLVLALSLASVFAVISTGGASDALGQSNSFRLFAWLLALEKVSESPVAGIGVPEVRPADEIGISVEVIDRYLIGESWYFDTAMMFGLPYTLLMLLAYISAFYGRGFEKRDVVRAVLFPFVLIDFTYGQFSGGILIYTWLWLLISASPCPTLPTQGDERLLRGPVPQRRLD